MHFLLLLLVAFLFLVTSCSKTNSHEWHQETGYRWADLSTGFTGKDGFERLSSRKTGVNFRNDISKETISKNRHYLNGSGVAVADIDANGLVDIYFASLEGPNKIYKNLGNFKFRDITDEAGVALHNVNSTGVLFADVTGNGFPDLLVTSLTGENSLFLNDGTGKFTLKEDSGLKESNGSKTMTLADITGNGLPDLYITNYRSKSVKDLYSPGDIATEETIQYVDGNLEIKPRFNEYFTLENIDGRMIRVEKGTKDELYLNRGEGKFERADDRKYFFDRDNQPAGLPDDWGLTAKFVDITGNMLPDIYVANDFWTPDRMWLNRGDGTFREMDLNTIRNMSFSAMGVDFSDINRDGHIDFVVTEMLSRDHTRRMRQTSQSLINSDDHELSNRNSVYLNRGDGTFAQIAHHSGLAASEWSWATLFMDVNLNGYEDLIVATGYLKDYLDMDTQIENDGIFEYPELRVSNKIFKNNGDLTFTDVSSSWGFGEEDIAMGIAMADLNNDGSLDLVVNRMNDEAVIYQNRTNAPRIAVRLRGKSPNTEGIGSKIELLGSGVEQSKQITSGGNYLSGSQLQAVFSADKNNNNHIITVSWPNGKKSRIEGVQANRIYEIDECYAAGPDSGDINKTMADVLFEDISNQLRHVHHEDEFDDGLYQVLLPQVMNRTGPGIAWIDYNGNGTDELFIASGKGGSMGIFEATGGEFMPVQLSTLTAATPGDQTGIIGWRENGSSKVVIGSANYEQLKPAVPSAYVYTINSVGQIETEAIPGIFSTTGPVAAADVTGNGYLDLFIGGRFNPTRYPSDADSRIFLNRNGFFESDEENREALAGLGLVTGAVFSDITQNGSPDLLVSTEWGSLRLFENRNGKLHEVTERKGLAGYKGWWKGVATGDFTNNGLIDIVAVNIGLNSPYQITNGYTPKMYFDDINWDNRLNIIEGYYDDKIGSYVPRRRLHDFESIPTILRQANTHRKFAGMSLDEIFDTDFNEVPFKEINTLEHMVFINNGSGFTAHPLPVEAQFTAGFHVGVADFDNDGNEDLFISQNNFTYPNYVPRQDAGRGLILKGDGTGNFTPLPGEVSGILIYGEQRGAAWSDINQNGKIDLAVTQNSGETRLFLNKTENRGIRIVLKGPPSNETAVGSSIRIIYEDGSNGPRREIQAGSGYWSQNSATQVMGVSGGNQHSINSSAELIEVIWFDGRKDRFPIKPGEMNYHINY